MSRVELTVPVYGMADTESVVLRWLHQPGERVAEGEPVVDIESQGRVTLESRPRASWGRTRRHRCRNPHRPC
jgi:hypothetical protein